MENRSTERVIDCEKCEKEIPFPTGDGSTVTRQDDEGGHCFCSTECAEEWEKNHKDSCR